MGDKMGKIRPQILAAILCGTLFGLVGMWIEIGRAHV